MSRRVQNQTQKSILKKVDVCKQLSAGDTYLEPELKRLERMLQEYFALYGADDT